MKVPINRLRGLSADVKSGLAARGIRDSDQLLEAGRTAKGRRDLARATGADERDILELVNRADLARIRGVAGSYSDLLENSGVDTVRELARRQPESLHERFVQVNGERHLVNRVPPVPTVRHWVEQAREMPERLAY